MAHYDVFNGDADGICALIQLRLAEPKSTTLVTGIKRDIELLKKVDANSGDSLTVLDISLEKNSLQLQRILDQGASVFYVDHHRAGVIPQHKQLITHIDTDPEVCTSLLVDHYLAGAFRAWAVTAAFGDNLNASAAVAAKPLHITADQLEQLKLLGVCINYNGYGRSLDDLHFPPAELYRKLLPYRDPLDFVHDSQSVFARLRDGYRDDIAKAEQISAEFSNAHVAVFLLPDEIWSRRISGVYGNLLANRYPARAHAVVSLNQDGGYLVSVRAPLDNKTGADQLCSEFPSGGGRKGAAGINHLQADRLAEFIGRFSDFYSR